MKLAKLVSSYVTFKQSTGMSFRTDAGVLRAFCRAQGDTDVADVDPRAVLAFIAGKGPVTTFWHQKFRVLRGFYGYAIARSYTDSLPLPSVIPKPPQPFTPHIYSIDELRDLLAATECLQTPKSPLQAVTFCTLLLLLYGTAMRIGEALSLTLADVNLRESLLTVRDGKFGKSRLVPIGPKLATELSGYARQRSHLPIPTGKTSAFFVTRTGSPLSYERANRLFQRVRKHASVCRDYKSRYQPRLHDIRHTAAVHRVVAWYRQGADVQRLLPQLATYLGHVDVASTQRYLTMTTDLLGEANRRFEKYAQLEPHHE